MAGKRSICSRLRKVLSYSFVPLIAAVSMQAIMAQQAIVLKNWPMSAASASLTAATGNEAGLLFISITPCRDPADRLTDRSNGDEIHGVGDRRRHAAIGGGNRDHARLLGNE